MSIQVHALLDGKDMVVEIYQTSLHTHEVPAMLLENWIKSKYPATEVVEIKAMIKPSKRRRKK